MKGNPTALAVFLAFSSMAAAGPGKPPASKPTVVSSQPSGAPTQTQRRLFSKWHGGSYEINGEKMTVVLGKKKKEITLPNLRVEGEASAPPLQLLCRKDGAKIIYRNRIEIYDSYDELLNGASAATVVQLKQSAIEGMLLKDGKEAVVAFSNGQVQHLELRDGGEFSGWMSKKPQEESVLTKANIGESGGFAHVIFPETGNYALVYTVCKGKDVAYEDQTKDGVTMRCFGTFCAIKNGKNETVETVRIPCPPKK